MASGCGGGTYMCRECGDCTKEHNKNIDDSLDIIEAIGIV